MKTTLKYLLVSITFLLTVGLNAQMPDDKFVVVLDAGHGGKDPGRPTKYGYKEKDIALDITLKIGKRLEALEDVKVIYTRKKDVFLELHERAEIANKADADLFISIHCNAHHTQAYGTETYVLGLHRNEENFKVAKEENEVIFLEEDYATQYEGFDPNSPESLIGLTLLQEDYLDQSIMLASLVQKNFTDKLGRRNRGVKQAGFWVLHNTYMPSVLVETGFISNRNEGRYLSSSKGKNEISKAVTDAILKYKASLNTGLSDFISSENAAASDDESEYPGVTFKVQIAASGRNIETKPFNFNGLDPISKEKTGKIYRYFYSESSNYEDIKDKKIEAIKKGYSTAFVVAYKNGSRVNINEVLKTKSNK